MYILIYIVYVNIIPYSLFHYEPQHMFYVNPQFLT